MSAVFDLSALCTMSDVFGLSALCTMSAVFGLSAVTIRFGRTSHPNET
jgi:hypothetical protein